MNRKVRRTERLLSIFFLKSLKGFVFHIDGHKRLRFLLSGSNIDAVEPF